MPERFTVIITSDRYGGEHATMDLEQTVIERFPQLSVDLRGAPATSEADLIALGADADALLVSTREAITPRVLDAFTRVRVVSRYGVGLDNVDLDAATRNGIVVTHYPQYCTNEVADQAMAMLLTLNRRIVELDDDVRAGAWHDHGPATSRILRGPVPALRDLTLGIIGFGRIGQAVARRAAAFGLRLLVHDPYASREAINAANAAYADLDDLLATADLITIHCPLTPETRGLIDGRRLELLKPHAAIVNTARGPIIALDALAAFLETHPTNRAALDVVDPEPLGPTSPFHALRNVILTPHAAYYSERSVETVRMETLASALHVLAGEEPATVANPAVLARTALRPHPHRSA